MYEVQNTVRKANPKARVSAMQRIKDRGAYSSPSDESGYAVLAVIERPAPFLSDDGTADMVADEIVVWYVQPLTGYVGSGKYFEATEAGEKAAIAEYDRLARN